MPDLEWRETAREGLRSNFEYIADDNPAAALALLEEIETKFAAKTVVQPASRPHSAEPPAQDGRDAQTTLICYSEHATASRSTSAFPSVPSDDLGLALMNLELHGCVGISAANALCDCGLVSPATFVKSRSDMGDFVFEAIEMELQATVEIGRISLAQATKHPFITEAFARMQIDQFATDERVVFDHGHLSQCSPKALETAFARSARSWRRGAAPNAQG